MPTKTVKPVEVETIETETKNGHKPLYMAVRKVLLAAMGAVTLAQDEMEDFVKKLVDRGELAEKDARKLMEEMREKRKKGVEKAEDEGNKRMDDILNRMNVPTKSDIDALSEKIAILAKKVEELKTT